MSIIELKNISKQYPGASTFAVDDVSFSLNKGEILALVGESGSGKTTLLRLIAGLEHPSKGEITLSGKTIVKGRKSVPTNKRRTGMVFQDYALFPHLTIFENVAFGLKGLNKKETEQRVMETIELTDLQEDVKKYPHQLSGGQQQRVALARALAPRPDLVLLDEPFSNLDARLRAHLREEVRGILEEVGATAVLVTHDREEALTLADQVAVMGAGRILQVGSPEELYRQPATPGVAA